MDAADLLRHLVEIPSPTGSEAEAVRFLHRQAVRDGFQARIDEVGNFIAETGRGGPLILFVGHIDTVAGTIPVRLDEGTLWGRGAVDAKGSLVAFYCAAREFLNAPNLRIRVVGAVDEEGTSRGAKNLSRSPPPDFIIIGEPSGVDAVTIAYKGVVRGNFEVRREHLHGAHQEESAADAAVAFWQSLLGEFQTVAAFDAVQARLESMRTRTDGLLDIVEAAFSFRVPPGQSARDLGSRVRAAGTAHGVPVDVWETVEPAEADKHTPLVAAYLTSLRAQGLTPRFKRKTGTADFNLLHEWFPTVPILAYGPGDSRLDHTPHERLAFQDLERAVRVNQSALAHLVSAVRTIGP